MVTFESKVTKNGNLKVSSQLREILGLYSGKRVTVTLDYTDPNEIKIPQEILDMEGKNGLFVSMPSQKGKDGNYHDICFPITPEFRSQLNSGAEKGGIYSGGAK